MEKQKPIHTLRSGSVEAAIWKNDGEKGAYYRATFSRSYAGKDGKLTSTTNFGARELPALTVLAIQVDAWIRTTTATQAEEVGDE